jgi:hypothetical protein
VTPRSLAARTRTAWRARWFPDAPLADLAIARVLLVAIVLHLNGGGVRFSNVARAPAITWDPVPFLDTLGVVQPAAWVMRALASASKVALLAAAAGLATNAALGCAFVLQLVQEGLLNSFGKFTHATIPLLYALLFCALAPCGRVWSIDALIRRVRTRGTAGATAAPRTSRFARWPFELLLVELAFYYFDAGFTKLSRSGLAWADGSTLQYYALLHGTVLGGWLAPHLGLCALLSAGALAFELGFPLALVFRRLRPWFLAAGVCFHVGNHLLLDLIFWPVFAVYPLVVPWSLLQRRAGTLLHRYGAPLRARLARGSRT